MEHVPTEQMIRMFKFSTWAERKINKGEFKSVEQIVAKVIELFKNEAYNIKGKSYVKLNSRKQFKKASKRINFHEYLKHIGMIF